MVSAFYKKPVALLLVNQATDRVFFKKVLGEKYHVIHAKDSLDAISKLMHGQISIVITHDKLTRLSIIEFCKKVREIDKLKDLPLLVYTTNLKKSYVKELLTAGATDFLREPLDHDEVYQLISEAMKSQNLKKKMSPLAQSIHSFAKPTSGKKLDKTRFSIRDQAVRAIKEAVKEKNALSLLVLSIDHFEKIRLRWGVDAINELAERLLEHLKESIRQQDLLMHIKDEKYLIVLPKTSMTAGKILAEDIKDTFKEKRFKTNKGSVRLTVSIGLTALDKEKAETSDAYDYLDMMLADGENCLVKAKQIGNRIVSK